MRKKLRQHSRFNTFPGSPEVKYIEKSPEPWWVNKVAKGVSTWTDSVLFSFQDRHELLPSHEGRTSLPRLQQEQQMIYYLGVHSCTQSPAELCSSSCVTAKTPTKPRSLSISEVKEGLPLPPGAVVPTCQRTAQDRAHQGKGKREQGEKNKGASQPEPCSERPALNSAL